MVKVQVSGETPKSKNGVPRIVENLLRIVIKCLPVQNNTVDHKHCPGPG